MNLQQLTTFCTVLSEGSMTAAAEKLLLTQPAVSQQIRGLEDELGVPLMVRGLRQVKPTMQGQLLYDYAKRILNLTQQAEVAIQTMSQEVMGHLRVGTINSIGMYLISPIIGMFLKHNSNLNIRLQYGNYQKTLEAMRNDQIDVAILPDIRGELDVSFDEFEEKFLTKDEMWLVAAGRDTNIQTRITLNQFPQKPVVVLSEMYPAFKKYLEQRLREGQIEYTAVFESDNVGTIKRVVESGLGWGFLPAHSIRKQVRSRRLTVVQVDDFEYSVNLNLYVRKTEKMHKMGEVFYRALQQQALSN